MDLASISYGTDRRATPLVVLHGLLGSSRNWSAVARRLAESRPVHALDLRNHGASAWAATMTYEEMAADVAEFIERRALAPAAVIGHSMGGKAAMVLALTRPALVERLLVVDIAPVTYPDRYGPYVAALRALPVGQLKRRGDADKLLAAAMPDPAMRAFLMQNLSADIGGLAWRVNLEAIAAAMPGISAFPDLAGSYAGPTLFLRGSLSDYLDPARDEAAIRRLFPAARIAAVEGAGHWVHAEKPEAFVAAAEAFLAEAAPRA